MEQATNDPSRMDSFAENLEAWLLKRSEEAREDRKTAVEAMRQLKVTEEALVASRQEYQELSAAVTTSDLDHASVVLIAKANAQDSEIVEAVKASAEEARETIAKLTQEVKAVFAAALKQVDAANALESALAAARQEVERHRRLCLAELGGPGVWPCGCHERILDSVGTRQLLTAVDGEIHQECEAHLALRADLAAARLRATPQDGCRFLLPRQDRACAEEYPENQGRWCGVCLTAALRATPQEQE